MNQITLDLNQPSTDLEITEDSEVTGLFIGKKNQQCKSKLNITHNKPNLNSRINIKAVVFDKSNFDLEAKLTVNKGAKQTDTYLRIDCLVMDESASARAVPSLEVNEDLVQAGHGATIGMVDQGQLHYLMSRGMDQELAEKLLVEAFISL